MRIIKFTKNQVETAMLILKNIIHKILPLSMIYKKVDDIEPYETDVFTLLRKEFRKVLKKEIPQGEAIDRLISGGFNHSGDKLEFKPKSLKEFHSYLDEKLGKEVADKIQDDVHGIINELYIVSKQVAASRINRDAAIKGSDKATIDVLCSANNFFVRNTYNSQLVDIINQKATEVLNRGLGAKELSGVLKDELSETIGVNSDNYFRILANDVTNRARTFAQIIQYRDVGIKSYEIQAMMDESTCPVCGYMNGRVFNTKTAGEIVQEIKEFGVPETDTDVEDFKQLKPWLMFDPKKAAKGVSAIYLQQGDRKIYLPNSAFSVDEDGIMSQSDTKLEEDSVTLEDLNCSLPPFHGSCRCTTIISEETIREYLGEQIMEDR